MVYDELVLPTPITAAVDRTTEFRYTIQAFICNVYIYGLVLCLTTTTIVMFIHKLCMQLTYYGVGLYCNYFR
jgi:hypothetical protein